MQRPRYLTHVERSVGEEPRVGALGGQPATSRSNWALVRGMDECSGERGRDYWNRGWKRTMALGVLP